MKRLADLQVTIVGLGLMGGSLALDLRPHVRKVIGVDVDSASLALAQQLEIADTATSDLKKGLAQADLVILATPVRTILTLLTELPLHLPQGCLLIDLGSTKHDICEAMAALPAGFHAIGGHPMCGKETSGLGAAEAGLYVGRIFVLSAVAEHVDSLIYEVALEMVQAVGAVPLLVSPGEHDEIVAVTSHLPYLSASLLMGQAAERAAKNPLVWPVSGPGLRDMSRLAGSNPDMMADILITNRPAVLAELHQFQHHVDALIALLEGQDEAALRHWLTSRQREHKRFRRDNR